MIKTKRQIKRPHILWFNEVNNNDVALVGGKNASLGEMYNKLTKKGIKIPNGFCVTAFAYEDFIKGAGIDDDIQRVLKDLNTHDVRELKRCGEKARNLILRARFPKSLEVEIRKAYVKLAGRQKSGMAVRSSATAEDLPDASFAGQQETYLNVRGERNILEATKKCFASLFTNRAISYRTDKGFKHDKVLLSVGIQEMVRADKGASGVMFTIDTESGFKDLVLINAIYGLGENIVQGKVTPDEYYVFKPTLKQGFNPIVLKRLGKKNIRMVYSNLKVGRPVKNVKVTEGERGKYALTDKEILKLAKWGMVIEEHYKRPMDIEWAKDGITNELYIVQARPETVHSTRDLNTLEEFRVTEDRKKLKSKVLARGKSVGNRIGVGPVRVIRDVRGINDFKKGEILVTEMTNPDWEPIMKIASGIVTNSGGRTCFSGETKVLTDRGFMEIKEIVKICRQEKIKVLSLNKDNLKIEWNRVTDGFERTANLISVNVSQTGRMKSNILKLTPDHKMLTFDNRKLVSREIGELLEKQEYLLTVQKVPFFVKQNFDYKLAYILGAIWTDGNVYLTRNHGEIQFIQKETKEKERFIRRVNDYFEDVFDYRFHRFVKKESSGSIRGKEVIGSATAYRCYSKERAQRFNMEKEKIFEKVLVADEKFLYNFLAGIIDGDGTYNSRANRINIFCADKNLLKAIVISCLRLGIVFTIVKNRTIDNVQIVNKIDEIFKYTNRVKGKYERLIMGIKLFSARQLLGDIKGRVNYLGRILPYIDNNFLIDAKKIINNLVPMIQGEAENHELTNIANSDLSMLRVTKDVDLGEDKVYNITVENNHNYVVFTSRYTPIVVNNCHAAIVSRELRIPCIVGTEKGTNVLRDRQEVTVDCSEGEVGYIYKGKIDFAIRKYNFKNLGKPKTKIMMNVGNPEEAFRESFIPNDGVGLAREEFIISSYIGVHPMALLEFDKVKDKETRKRILKKTREYKTKKEFYIQELAEGIAQIAAAYYPKEVIVRLSDFKTNEYATLLGGKYFEPEESNPMLGWRGAARYYDPKFRPAFELECIALTRVRKKMGLNNVKIMVPFCRTVDEGQKVLKIMEECGLKRGVDGLEVYVMCEIPSNVILAREFAKIFDGFSIGTNDLTQLVLGVDRDSEIVAHVYDEKNKAVKDMVSQVIKIAKEEGRKIGLCGQAPSDFPDFAEFLVGCGIDSMSLTPDTVVRTTAKVLEKEKRG